MCRRALTAAVAAGVLALLAAANAGAATPQQIYRDLADNGRLDRTYSRADIERAFDSNPTIPGYVRPSRQGLRTPQVRRAPDPAPSDDSDGSSLPFTGLDAALFGAVGGPLLLLGAGVRRFARVQAAGKVS
jgi:hypothetical protein